MPARERPDAQGGRPQLVRRQSDGLSTGELLTENGELRREVRRLRSTPGREEGLSALERAQAEIASLRQQLKDQALRDQEARAATAPEAVEGAAAQADMDIQPRSRGKHFHIRGWTSDPQEPVSRARATGAGVPDSAGTPGPPEDSAQLVAVAGAEPAAPNEGVLVEMVPAEVEEEPPRTGLPAAEGSGLMSWARGEDAVRQLLKRAEEQLEAGSLDGAGEAFREALDAHLADAKRPYLAFSAALRPALHGHLVGHGLLTAGGEADRPADPACAAARRESYAELIRRAVADHPPAQRPRGTSRSRHVREHCAHAGLCLDLALLDRPGLGARAEAPQADAARGRSRSRSARRRLLEQAGQRLQALQADMDRLRAEAERRAEGPASPPRRWLPRQGAPPPLAAPPEEPAPATAPGAPEEPPLLEQAAEEAPGPTAGPAPDAGEGAAQLVAADGPPGGALTAEEDGKPEHVRAAIEDSLLVPHYGQFLERQLLPLYVGLVPLEELECFNCGIPLDSEDERKAWKESGRPAPPPASRGGARRRRRSRAARGTGARELVPRPSQDSLGSQPTPADGEDGARAAARPWLGGLVQAGQRQIQHLRGGMENSIVEKRGKERAVPSNVPIPSRVPPASASRAQASSQLEHQAKLSASAATAPPSLRSLLQPTPSRHGMLLRTPRPIENTPMSIRKRPSQGGDLLSTPGRAPRFDLLNTPG